MKIQKAVKDETVKVAKGEAIGVAALLLVWFIIHLLVPTVTFDYKVIIAALLGGVVAVGNFLLLGISVQKLTSIGDEDSSKHYFKSTYRKRMLLQIVWGILAFALPCFNGIAGVIPLLFPTFTIRVTGVTDALTNLGNKNRHEVKQELKQESKQETIQETIQETTQETIQETTQETIQETTLKINKETDKETDIDTNNK